MLDFEASRQKLSPMGEISFETQDGKKEDIHARKEVKFKKKLFFYFKFFFVLQSQCQMRRKLKICPSMI